jgi:hypothetical protein
LTIHFLCRELWYVVHRVCGLLGRIGLKRWSVGPWPVAYRCSTLGWLDWLASGSRAGSVQLVITTELKTELGSARYPNELSRAESSQPRAVRASSFFVQP